ncbi:hypothetical protein [Deinococcus hohokamensis]|uniref:Transposase n=1 Tax=Deinococcus hohokamensis TaxID=309883 RepID=A0ABV9I655_9DEIO
MVMVIGYSTVLSRNLASGLNLALELLSPPCPARSGEFFDQGATQLKEECEGTYRKHQTQHGSLPCSKVAPFEPEAESKDAQNGRKKAKRQLGVQTFSVMCGSLDLISTQSAQAAE